MGPAAHQIRIPLGDNHPCLDGGGIHHIPRRSPLFTNRPGKSWALGTRNVPVPPLRMVRRPALSLASSSLVLTCAISCLGHFGLHPVGEASGRHRSRATLRSFDSRTRIWAGSSGSPNTRRGDPPSGPRAGPRQEPFNKPIRSRAHKEFSGTQTIPSAWVLRGKGTIQTSATQAGREECAH